MALKDDGVEQCLTSCGSESKCGVQSKRRCESHESPFVLLDFQHAGVRSRKSVVYETECRHVAVQRGKQDQNHL